MRSSTTQTTSELAVTEVAMRLPKGVVSRKDKVRKMFWRLQLISSYYFTPNAYVRFGIGLSTATGGKQTKKDNPIEVKGKAAFELSMGVGVTV
ncbi:MAG: hypothetical protein LBJ42_02665 [Holosporales bacterium]|nr:hypothetical protein [Holosporales bacterium]